jgi:probable selenate reductase FAD-binding subunit
MIREFHTPDTVAEAVALKQELGAGAHYLAGGVEINCSGSPLAPEHVISLAGLDLGGVRSGAAGLTIGACCTLQEVLEAPGTPEALRAACRNVVNRNIRNAATVGGHLACNKSCADLIPILVALQAEVYVAGPEGEPHTLPLMEYLLGAREDLVTKITLPPAGLARLAAVGNVTRTANDLSILTAAVTLRREGGAGDGDTVREPIVVVGGVAAHVVRLASVEEALAGQPLPPRERIEELVSAAVTPVSDLRGSAEYKRLRAGILVATVAAAAWQDTGRGGEA